MDASDCTTLGSCGSGSQRSTSTSSKYHLVTRKHGVQSADLPKAILGRAPLSSQLIYTMGRESTAGVLQPLIPKMPTSHPQAHAPTAYRTYAGCEKVSPDSPHGAGGTDNAHDESWVSRFVRIFKGVIALAIVLSTLWWFSGHQLSAPHGNEPTITLPNILPPRNYARASAPASSLLEVFQIHPPVLTVANNGALQITDDRTNTGSQTYDHNHAVCEKVLVVHSFGYSYGHPFVANYTAPTCKFNRVTWNLTVVSAGRQFDRLGIVYLGDIEVFRTSTAEPTANGIIWTYLKVSSLSEYRIVVTY